MLEEAAESVRLIGELLDAGTEAHALAIPATNGTGLGWTESPRGKALAWVALDQEGRISGPAASRVGTQLARLR